jgi:uncharacterized protein involved in exopolysaccharide biosynthesis
MPTSRPSGETSPSDLFIAIARRWKLITATIALGTLIAVAYALVAAPVFRAEVLLTPAPTPGAPSLGSSLGARVGGLGQLLGVSTDGDSRATLVATLGSLKLARSFVSSSANDTLAQGLFPERFDERGALAAGKRMPTELEMATRFRLRHLDVEDSKTTRLITVGVRWGDAEGAAALANAYIAHANAIARSTSTGETKRNLAYLRREFAQTEPVEIRQAIASLIESELSKAAVASIRVEFAYQVLDPATPPPLRIFPKRTLIVAIGAAIGAFVGVALALALAVRAQLRDAPATGA